MDSAIIHALRNVFLALEVYDLRPVRIEAGPLLEDESDERLWGIPVIRTQEGFLRVIGKPPDHWEESDPPSVRLNLDGSVKANFQWKKTDRKMARVVPVREVDASSA